MIKAAREDFSSKQASRLIKRNTELEERDDSARADLAERQVKELQQQLKAAEYRAQKADELAKMFQEGRDEALDKVQSLQTYQGHDRSV